MGPYASQAPKPVYVPGTNAMGAVIDAAEAPFIAAYNAKPTAYADHEERAAQRQLGAAPVMTPSRDAPLSGSVVKPAGDAPLSGDRLSPEQQGLRAMGATADTRFTPDATQPGLRSGQMRFGPQAATIHGTSTADATQMQAPEGGGYVTGKGGRAIFLPSQAATPRDPNAQLDVNGNDMRRTNAMKGELRGLQRDRLMRDMGGDIKDPNVIAAAHASLGQMDKEDALAAVNARTASDAANHAAELGLRRDQLKQQDKQFGETMAGQRAAAQLAKEKDDSAYVNEALQRSGLKGDDLQGVIDFADMNYRASKDPKAKTLSQMSREELHSALPQIVTRYKMSQAQRKSGQGSGTIQDPVWSQEAIAAEKAKDPTFSTHRDMTLKDLSYSGAGLNAFVPDWESDDEGRIGLKDYIKRLPFVPSGRSLKDALYKLPSGDTILRSDMEDVSAPLGKKDIRKLMREGGK